MGIVKSLFRKGGDRASAGVQKTAMRPDTPQLFMLTPDAAGIAAYQISQNLTARDAEAYLDEHLRGEIREGTIVFWGLTWLPAPSGDGEAIEPVVLIRDVRRQGQVYTFSFTDVESAYDFIRHEMKAGLDLGQVALYWALQARISVDFWGRATSIPSNPPLRARMHIVARREETAVPPADDETDDLDVEVECEKPVAAVKAEPLPTKLAELEEDELAKVALILKARGIVPFKNGKGSAVVAGGETAGATEAATEAEEQMKPEDGDAKPVADETVNVQLSDVYGGPMRIVRTTDWDSLYGLGEFGREQEEPDEFLTEFGWTVEEIAAPAVLLEEENEGGARGAWANICFAMDRALDAYVARRVVATIAWRRLSAALAEAARASITHSAREVWRNGAPAASAPEVQGARVPLCAEASGVDNLLIELKAAIRRARAARGLEGGTADATPETSSEENTKRNVACRRPHRAKVEEAYGGVGANDTMSNEEKKELPAETESREEAVVAEDVAAEEIVDGKAAIELWRFRENGRFESRDEIFHGFESPPGRF